MTNQGKNTKRRERREQAAKIEQRRAYRVRREAKAAR